MLCIAHFHNANKSGTLNTDTGQGFQVLPERDPQDEAKPTERSDMSITYRAVVKGCIGLTGEAKRDRPLQRREDQDAALFPQQAVI